jgi:hypothetical protein
MVVLNGTRPLVAETPAPLKQRILRRVQSESSLCKPSPVQPTLHMCRGNCSLDHLHHAGSAQVPGTDEGTLSIQMCHSERQQGSKRGVLGSKRGHDEGCTGGPYPCLIFVSRPASDASLCPYPLVAAEQGLGSRGSSNSANSGISSPVQSSGM